MDWLQVFVNLILTGILLYVFQRIIDERSAKRLEEFKAELQSLAFEKETRFSKLHEIRVQAIAELHRKLSHIHNNLSSLRHNLESDNPDSFEVAFNDVQKVGNMIDEFRFILDENILYVSKELHRKLTMFYMYAVGVEGGLSGSLISKDFASRTNEDSRIYIEQQKQSLLNASSLLSEKIQPLSNEIEIEFRRLLGS